MNVRACRQCEKMVDFDEPWCQHETMEESAWLDMPKTSSATFSELALEIKDPEIIALAEKLGAAAAKEFDRRMDEGVGLYRPWDDQEEED